MCLVVMAIDLGAQELSPEVLLLARIKVKMAENLKGLPNYTCLQTIERSTRDAGNRRYRPLDTVRVEVALVDGKELFAWPGEWMSLNGLSEVPDEVAKYLVKWKGRQLELMGLRKSFVSLLPPVLVVLVFFLMESVSQSLRVSCRFTRTCGGLLDVAGLVRLAQRREDLAAGVCDQDVILNADAAPARDVNARFIGEDIAGDEEPLVAADVSQEPRFILDPDQATSDTRSTCRSARM